MDLSNIIYLYSVLSANEEANRPKSLSQEALKTLKWKPMVIKKKLYNKVSTEKFLENNLKDFLEYMFEYSGI